MGVKRGAPSTRVAEMRRRRSGWALVLSLGSGACNGSQSGPPMEAAPIRSAPPDDGAPQDDATQAAASNAPRRIVPPTDWADALVLHPRDVHVASAGLGPHPVAMSDHFDRLYTLALDGSLVVWGLERGEALERRNMQWSAHDRASTDDGQYLVMQAPDGLQRVRLADDQRIHIPVTSRDASGVAISPEAERVVSAHDRELSVWGFEGTRVKRLGQAELEAKVEAVAVDDAGVYVAGGIDASLQRWREPSGDPEVLAAAQPLVEDRWGRQEAHPLRAVAIARGRASSQGQTFVVRADGKLLAWSDASVRARYEVDAIPEGERVTALRMSHDGQRIACGRSDGSVVLFDAATGEQRATLTSPRHTTFDLRGVRHFSFSADDRSLAVANADGHLWAIDIETQTVSGRMWTIPERRQDAVPAPDGSGYVTGHADGTLREWALAGSQRAVFDAHPGPISKVCVSRDAQTYASAGAGGIKLWHRQDGALREGIFLERDPGYREVALSPDAALVVSVDAQSKVRVHRAADGKELARVPTRVKNPEAIEVSSDATLFIGGWDGDIEVWDLAPATPKRLWRKSGARVVWEASFSPDGSMLVVGGHDDELTVWEARSGRKLGAITNPYDAPSQVSWCPDGRAIIGRVDAHSLRWRIPPGAPWPQDVDPERIGNAALIVDCTAAGDFILDHERAVVVSHE